MTYFPFVPTAPMVGPFGERVHPCSAGVHETKMYITGGD
jgi:hypothetical protein